MTTREESMDAETRVRFASILCREICAGLELPPRPSLTAVHLVRVVYKQSSEQVLQTITCPVLAEVCVLLAGKTEEEPRAMSVKAICKTSLRIEAVRNLHQFEYAESLLGDKIRALKQAEMTILAAMGFVVPGSAVTIYPHRYLVWLLEILAPVKGEEGEDSDETKLAGAAWGYLNDAMILDLAAVDPKATTFDVACAALLLAGFELQVPLPNHPRPWLEAVGANEEAVERIATELSTLVFEWECPKWIL